MKRIISYVVIFILAFTSVVCSNTIPIYANTRTKTRTINIVYDDSGSMVYDGVTSWSQAKYAMKVFAAMMGESDKINIYPMTSFAYKPDGSRSSVWGNVISMSGSDSPESRIDKIEKMNGDNGQYRHTPIQSVQAAGNALQSDTSNEKWLIILTDGAFDQGDRSLSYDETRNSVLEYAGKNNINVAYVAIGNGALDLTGVSSNEHFYPFATDINHILDTVTQVGKLVFNYQSIPLSGQGTYTFDADIPLSKVIIFAQGNNAQPENLKVDGKKVSGKQSSVHVEISKNTPYYPQNDVTTLRFGDNLNGQLITYQCKNDKKPFPSGKYSFDSNVSDVEVFFEPGLDVQTTIEDGNGEKIDLSKRKIPEIQAGEKTVHIRMVNPLTGDVVNPEDSQLLPGVKLIFSIIDKDGNVTECGDGEKIVFPEGDIDIYSKAKFAGDIEKNSEVKSIHVEPGGLSVNFSSKSYDVDLVTSTSKEDILVEIVSSDGTPISKEEFETLQFEITGYDGVDWSLESTDKLGTYKVIPKVKDKNGVKSETNTVEMICTLTSSGVNKKGTGKTKITGETETTIDLILTTTLPKSEVVGKDNQKYMFDPNVRGINESAPYISVDVEVQELDGTKRPLNEEEWESGLKGFTFSSKTHEGNLLWKFISIICRQKVEFEAVKGEKISSYKLYLSGLSVGQIRPNASELQTTLTITLPSGVKERGQSDDIVSVLPAPLWVYIGRFVIILTATLLILTFVIMELRKKRFSKKMVPHTFVIARNLNDGLTKTLEGESRESKIQYRILPPWKDEERDITMVYGGYMEPIQFHCVATGGRSFKITNPKVFERVKDNITFSNQSYEDSVKDNRIMMRLGGRIELTFVQMTEEGTIIMSFTED